jgi:hypothetical protein
MSFWRPDKGRERTLVKWPAPKDSKTRPRRGIGDRDHCRPCQKLTSDISQDLAFAWEINEAAQQEPSTQEVLAGLVERVTFHNSANGFCVLGIKARGHRDLVTVIGHAATISAGEWVTASGDRANDRTYGQQFNARFMRTSAPTSIDGIDPDEKRGNVLNWLFHAERGRINKKLQTSA